MISPTSRSWLRCLATLFAVSLAGCRTQAPQLTPLHAIRPATPPSLFRDVRGTAGLDFRWGPRDVAGLTIRDMMGFGCAFLDYDGDGRPDVLLVARDHCELYRNRGDGTFENVTERAFPHAPRRPYLMGCSVCDYDGDGRPDVFVSGYGRSILYHNEGDGTFRDVTGTSGLAARGPYDWTTSSAWADVDGDGLPDLYVCRYVRFTPSEKQFCSFKALDGSSLVMTCGPGVYAPQIGSLYHNDGSGLFHDVTREAGLSDAHGKGLGCRFCDFNADGRPDLFIANDQLQQDLYLNVGHGRFRNVAAETGTAYGSDGTFIAGMGVDWGDYDNDGQFDLLVANYAGRPKCLFHNEGHNVFVESGAVSGITASSLSSLTFGANFVDIDNDGRLDIVMANGHVQGLIEKADATTSYRQTMLLFHNLGGGRFDDITADAGPDFGQRIVGRGIAVADFDGDGRQDLLVVNAEGAPLLLHNDTAGGHFLSVRCFGANGRSEALGARITVKAGKLMQIREVYAGGSYLSSDAPDSHFGLGSATQADTVTIQWPDRRTAVFHSVAADHVYAVSEKDERLRQLPPIKAGSRRQSAVR